MRNSIADSGKVLLGGFAPSLPAAVEDNGKVRLGGFAPTLAVSPAPKPIASDPATKDSGRVHTGGSMMPF
jgi:hypothetical protein